jgi:hypothetical protein
MIEWKLDFIAYAILLFIGWEAMLLFFGYSVFKDNVKNLVRRW